MFISLPYIDCFHKLREKPGHFELTVIKKLTIKNNFLILTRKCKTVSFTRKQSSSVCFLDNAINTTFPKCKNLALTSFTVFY